MAGGSAGVFCGMETDSLRRAIFLRRRLNLATWFMVDCILEDLWCARPTL